MSTQIEALAKTVRREMGAAALSELIARYERAELSEGQLCKLLGLDRVETRALVDASRLNASTPKNHVCGTPDAMCDIDCMRASTEWPMCEADSDRMERAAIAIEALTEANERLREALNDIALSLEAMGARDLAAKALAARGDKS